MTSPAPKHLHLHVDAADAIARRLSEQEETIVRLAEENAKLKARVEMLDIANEQQSQETAKARKRAEVLASVNGRLTMKLIQYHEEAARAAHLAETPALRTPEQADDLADQIAFHREHGT